MKSVALFDLIKSKSKVSYALLGLILWLMLWGGYNAGIWRLKTPKNILGFFHGLRALLPLLAAYLATLLLFKRFSISIKIFKGPLGLISLYTIFGIVASLLSREPLTALYWGSQYGSVLLILWVISLDPKALFRFSELISLNWKIIALITIGLFGFFLLQPGVFSSLLSVNLFGARPYEGLFGIPAEKEILGMVGTRPTGLGRYAGIAAIVALARIWHRKKRSKSVWFWLFFFFLFVLLFSQARTAIIGFLAGAFLIFYLQIRPKSLLILGTISLLLLLAFFGVYEALYTYLAEKMPFVLTFSGRITGIWREDWRFFLKSPLLGFGFYADRIFLEAGHAHNAILHALIQTGIAGTIPFILAFIWAWIILFRLFRRPSILKTKRPFLIEIAGVLAFLTVRSVTESTGAFFGADWLLLAPLLAYLQQLNQEKLD